MSMFVSTVKLYFHPEGGTWPENDREVPPDVKKWTQKDRLSTRKQSWNWRILTQKDWLKGLWDEYIWSLFSKLSLYISLPADLWRKAPKFLKKIAQKIKIWVHKELKCQNQRSKRSTLDPWWVKIGGQSCGSYLWPSKNKCPPRGLIFISDPILKHKNSPASDIFVR